MIKGASVKNDGNLWGNFKEKFDKLREIKTSHGDSQKQLSEILNISVELINDQKLMAEHSDEFSKHLRYLWASCSTDAVAILNKHNPSDYTNVSNELLSLALNFEKLIPLIKKFIPITEQEQLFLDAENIYRKHKFWIKTSKIGCSRRFPLSVSSFFVNRYEAKLTLVTDEKKREKIIEEMAEGQVEILSHALEYVSESKKSPEDFKELQERIMIIQKVINDLVEEKLKLHKSIIKTLWDQWKIPDSKELCKIETEIYKISVIIIETLFQLCEDLLTAKGFKTPKFCVVGTGSFSRKELTPNSDFDCAIMVDQIKDPQQEKYFDNLLDLVITNIELLHYRTLPIDIVERALLKKGLLINTPKSLVEWTKSPEILKNPDGEQIEASTFGLNFPVVIHRSFTEKMSSSNLFESYLHIWYKEVGSQAEKFGKIILKNLPLLIESRDKDSIKEDLFRPVIFWALGFGLIYNENYRSAKQMIASYQSGIFPGSTREILNYLKQNKNNNVPKKVQEMAGCLIKIFDYAMSARNLCQITDVEEKFNPQNEQIQKFKNIIARSKDIANEICAQPESTMMEHFFGRLFSKTNNSTSLKQVVEAKDESSIQDYLNLFDKDAIQFRFPQQTSFAEEKQIAPKESQSHNTNIFLPLPKSVCSGPTTQISTLNEP